MFREVITVKWKADSYTATKIPLSKEISNVSNSYHIRIQAYQLDKTIDDKTVFILQLKHNRNVRNVGSTSAASNSISMHNQYHMDMGHSHRRRHQHHATRLNEARKRSSSSFFDHIWLEHKSKAFLHATVNTIFRAFDCDDFIQYNEHTNQFEFNFEAKQNMTTLTKYVSLSRTKYTQEEAETLLKDRHHAFESIKPCKVQVCCVNSHEIEDKDWDFEVNLTLLPGKYEFCVNELFGKTPTQIHARDYPRVRQFYEGKLKQFVRKRRVFNLYLTHLSTFEPRYKMMEWSKNGVESGPLFGLYSILCEVEPKDDIWDNLFEICLRDKIDDKIIRNSISEQTVADFIALSLKHYVKDSVKRRIQIRETTQIKDGVKDTKEQPQSTKKHTKQNKEGLDTYVLSESDRYILSIILPYFGSPPLKTIHKSVANESLPSGLFNHACDALKGDKDEDDTWNMKVEPLKLKDKLLKHLCEKGYDVVKQYYVAVYQHVPAVEKGDKTRWTFYIRPSTYAEIFNGKHKINMNAYTFTDKFEFRERQMPNVQYLNLIIKCVDVSFACDWAMWTKRKLRLYSASLGYWKLLTQFDDNARVPVDHLDCVLALLRHDAMSISPKLLRNENQELSVVFLKENDALPDAMTTAQPQAQPYNQWSTSNVEAEYQLTYWNGKQTGNSSLSLRLIKSVVELGDKAEIYAKRDSHFIHYRSRDDDIEWLWYDNDDAKYREYDLGKDFFVPKQLEATYLGVSEEMFPQDQFQRDGKSAVKERQFNCAQIPQMTAAIQTKFRGARPKPFVLRFTFQKHGGKIINIEQLAINSYYDQFPRNVKRVYSGKTGVKINDEEQRVSSLGEMNIYQSKNSIIICWKFAKCAELGIAKTYHYKAQMPIEEESKFKRLLASWRRNTLFDQTMTSRAMCIVQSRQWKTDLKMPKCRDLSVDEPDKKSEKKSENSDDEDYDSTYDANDNDDDDDKDEEKQHKTKKKKKKKGEECIACQMIESINDNKKEESSEEEDPSIPIPDHITRERSLSTAQLARIETYNGLFAGGAITDMQWDLLDAIDDRQRRTSNMIKIKPDYVSRIPNAEPMFDEWKRRHAPDKFRRKLYKLVSLSFVQSIISVMAHQLANNDKYKEKTLIVVISNAQDMYKEMFNLSPSNYTASGSKLCVHLFDGAGDIKRIDSKGAIYSIAIGDALREEIIAGGYLHEFVSMTTVKYKETLVLFNRGCDKLYVSHNGYLSKLSLALGDEDLHYFLPLFIPLKVGDCVNIEAFSSPDTGTIVSLWRNSVEIMYRVRSTENVYYIMNYHTMVNRTQPRTYWYNTRKDYIRHEGVWNDVKLWKTEVASADPSDASHPLHGVILSLVESSKQAIASIESQLHEMRSSKGMKKKQVETAREVIQTKLQNTGAMFLFYKSVRIENKSEEVLEFERQREEEREYIENDKQKKGGERSARDDVDDDVDEPLEESNPHGLSHLIKFFLRNKLICDVQKYESPERTSYDMFCRAALDILQNAAANRVFVCHMIETKKYVLEAQDGAAKEDALDLEANKVVGAATPQVAAEDDPYNMMDLMEDDDNDEWLTLEPEEEDEPHRDSGSDQIRMNVVIRSSFECSLSYSFVMASTSQIRAVLTIEDLMMMQKDKRDWSNEDHKLLTQFHAHHIYNKFDLSDKQLIQKLKIEFSNKKKKKTQATTHLEKKFTEFTDWCSKQSFGSSLKQYVIAGVNVTRHAKCLQSYIDCFHAAAAANGEMMGISGGAQDPEVISSNTDHTMIVSYNPIQTVVVTSSYIKDVTHPIHLYRAAYDETFYPRAQIDELHAEWMQTQTKPANIIGAVSTLLRYNKKYEIILVPSSIHLSRQNFLQSRCEMVAPEHEAIADYRITFLYKGLLYRYCKKKAKNFRKNNQKVISFSSSKQQNRDDLDDDDDDDKIFVDEIKFLLRLLDDNISEEEPDAMDPHEDMLTSHGGHGTTLRASIKRNKRSDRIFRWLNIGCGSCFLHETTGRSKDIGPKKGTNYEIEFPKRLQKAMFLYHIDCRVPFNEDIVGQDSQCPICQSLMIDPATIGNPDCQHMFCRLCIQQWYFVNYQNQQRQLMNPHHQPQPNSTSKCPLCRANVVKICVQKDHVANMKKGIPTTIYQQIMEENQSRFTRQYLVDVFLRQREQVLEAEHANLQQRQQQQHSGAAGAQANLQQQMENNPRLQNQLAGYGYDPR